MRTILTAILVAVTTSLLCGCGVPQEALLGSWESTEIQCYTGSSVPFTFNDEPFTATNRTEYWSFGPSNILVEIFWTDFPPLITNYCYRIDKNTLYVHFDERWEDELPIRVNSDKGTMIINARPYWVMRLKKLSKSRIYTDSIQQSGPAYPPQGVGSADP